MAEPSSILRLTAGLPVSFLADFMHALHRSAIHAGCSSPTIGPGLEVFAVLPELGARVEHHEVVLSPSTVHEAMLTWSCSCGEKATSSYGDVGGAAFFGVEHVPAGEDWSVVPHRSLWDRPAETDA